MLQSAATTGAQNSWWTESEASLAIINAGSQSDGNWHTVTGPTFEPRSVAGLEEIPVGFVPGHVRRKMYAGFSWLQQAEVIGKHAQPEEEGTNSASGLVLEKKVCVTPAYQLLD